jgi:8-oxo-dGTP diphosphatase
MGDQPIEYVWHDDPVPAGLPVSQVYGWLLCPVTGRVLIQEQDDGTLAREAFEENTVRIAPATAYLGYREVRRPGRPIIAQVRMAAVIAEFAPRAPDPDNGRLNHRYLTSLAAAPRLLGWGQPAEAQARAAAEAGRRWGLAVDHPAAAGYED